MKNKHSIHEEDLDGALNALFLKTYSHTEDEGFARFVLDQQYDIVMTDEKRTKLLAKLNRGRGTFFLLLALIGLIATIALPLYFHLTDKKGETRFPVVIQPKTPAPNHENNTGLTQSNEAPDRSPYNNAPMTSTFAANSGEINAVSDTIRPLPIETIETKRSLAENTKKPLPYFDEAGLAYFQGVKDNLLLQLLKLDDQLYTKVDPGATNYKGREILVSPFVMSNFPVTNLYYKVFLADLFRQGKINELENCLPKQDVWNQYACGKLAENYFNNESYNHFPVVNLGKEAMLMYCKWIEEEMNKTPARTKSKIAGKKKEVIARLPYDYEWIYAADAAYAIIPDCGGYNTIYDASEGLVNASFVTRTSKLSKQGKKELNRIDQLNDLNRFGMTEDEMLSIYKEAMNFTRKNAFQNEASSARRMEDCCLAGHVVELINTRDGSNTLRGSCWKDKAEYQSMAGDYRKFDASPFVGFRVVFVSKNGTYKAPFW